MKRRGLIAALVVAVLVGGGLWYAGSRDAMAPGGESAKTAKVVISGFRSARFGMDETAVRQAIEKDFGPNGRIRVIDNTAQKTRVMALRVRNLVPEAPVAQLGYVFGHQSGKLIQVNAVWGSAITPEVTGAELAGLAMKLKAYFTGLGFAPDKSMVDQRLRNGGMLVFQGRDDDGRMVRLVYRETRQGAGSASPPDDERSESAEEKRAYSLRLAYIANPAAADIFRSEAPDNPAPPRP